MISFSPNDSSILMRVLQYNGVPEKDRLALLSKASKPAQKVAKLLLKRLPTEEQSDDIREAAAIVQEWLDTNRRIGERRTAHKLQQSR